MSTYSHTAQRSKASSPNRGSDYNSHRTSGISAAGRSRGNTLLTVLLSAGIAIPFVAQSLENQSLVSKLSQGTESVQQDLENGSLSPDSVIEVHNAAPGFTSHLAVGMATEGNDGEVSNIMTAQNGNDPYISDAAQTFYIPRYDATQAELRMAAQTPHTQQ